MGLASNNYLFVLSALYAAAEIYKQRQDKDLKIGEAQKLEQIEQMIESFDMEIATKKFSKHPQYIESIKRRHSNATSAIKKTFQKSG